MDKWPGFSEEKKQKLLFEKRGSDLWNESAILSLVSFETGIFLDF
jgi:hypothetical protein